MGLFMGRIADRANRRNIIVVGAFIWNLALAGMGTSGSFWQLLVYRLVLGVGQAFSNPASYSMIADVFPPLQLPRANGLYASGVYIGGGLASFSEVMGAHIGWRWAFYLCAIIGGAMATILFFTVAEPTRKEARIVSPAAAAAVATDSDAPPSLTQTLRFFFTDAHTATLLAAASVRFIGGYAIGGYLPVFYSLKFSSHSSEYSIINAFVVGCGGFISSSVGGYLTSWWLSNPHLWGSSKVRGEERRTSPSPRAHLFQKVTFLNRERFSLQANYLVPAIGALSAIPFICLCLLSSDFYVSLCVGLTFEYLTAESWFGPYMSALQSGVPKTMRAMVVSVMMFLATFFGSLASYIIGVVQDSSHAGSDASSIKIILLITVTSSYGVAAWLFIVASAFQPKTTDRDAHGVTKKGEASEESALLAGNGQGGDAEDRGRGRYEVA